MEIRDESGISGSPFGAGKARRWWRWKEIFRGTGDSSSANRPRAIVSDKVIDIFDAAGLKKPDISILSDEFPAEVRGLPHKNLAVETLRKLLSNEIKIRSRKFLIQSRSFSEMLEASIRKYQNRAIETAAVIGELIALAKQMREAAQRVAELGLAEDEVAFYDALEVNDSAVKILGDENLRFIARELLKTIRENVSIDWTAKESVRAKLRVMVKRILRKYGYPPDKQEKATQTVLQQPSCSARIGRVKAISRAVSVRRSRVWWIRAAKVRTNFASPV